MNKKRMVTVVTAGIILITSTLVWTYYDQRSIFQKIEGIVQSQNGVLAKIPGDKEKLKVVNSIDPVTGIPIKKLDSALPVSVEKYEEVKISHVFDGHEAELTFDVAYHDKGPVLLSNNNRPYVITPIPNSRESLIKYRENLYVIDIDNKSIRNALADQVDRYSKKDVEKRIADKDIENLGLTWGGNASFNVDGTKMVYFSNRNTAFNDQLNGEMWLKDWKTGEEKPLREWRSSILGWGADDEVFLDSIGEFNSIIESFNINTGQTTQIIDQFMTVGFSYPFLIYQQEPDLILVYHIDTKETKLLETNFPNMIQSFITNENSPWVLIVNAPDRTKAERTILVTNMETGEIKQFAPLANELIEYTQWIDDKQFLVNVRKKGQSKVDTYIVDLDTFWGGK